MKIDVDLTAINHCDHENCTFGTIELDCPICQSFIHTTDNWYKFTDWGNQPKTLDFKCDTCKNDFEVKKENGDWFYEPSS